MHDMSNTRKEIAARLGFAAGFGRDYPSKVTETAGASGGTWSKKMARYGSKKAAVITYTDGGQVGQVYQDPDNPRVFKAFDMGGRLLGEGSEMDMKRKVEAITASRPGAKATMTREQTEEQKAGLKIMSAADPAVGAKIAKLIKEGKPQDQAVAIALDMKRRGEL